MKKKKVNIKDKCLIKKLFKELQNLMLNCIFPPLIQCLSFKKVGKRFTKSNLKGNGNGAVQFEAKGRRPRACLCPLSFPFTLQ